MASLYLYASLIFCPFIYLNFFQRDYSQTIIYFLSPDVTVIRCVGARRDEGKKAVSVMCVIVYVDTSFHPALSRWEKRP